jgi:predicted nucleic acid-binding protein
LALRGILLDSNAYSAFKRGQPEALEIIRHAPALCLNSVVMGELLGGFVAGSREARNRRELEEFCSSGRVRSLSVDDRTAEHYSAIYLHLRRRGTPIPTNDMWIAASALQHNLGLFTYDGHFSYIAGLSVAARLEGFLL